MSAPCPGLEPVAPGRPEVALLRWPVDAHRRSEWADRGVPRLWLVEAGSSIPAVDLDEDWIRVPASERDVWARMTALAMAARERRTPRLVHGVVLSFEGRTVVVAEKDAPLVQRLIDAFGSRVAWPEVERVVGSARRSRVVERVARVRARVAGAGLDIATHADGVVLGRAPRAG